MNSSSNSVKNNHFKSTSHYKRIELSEDQLNDNKQKQGCIPNGISNKITKFFGQLIPSKQYKQKSFSTINNDGRQFAKSRNVQILKNCDNDESINCQNKKFEGQNQKAITASIQKQYFSSNKQKNKKSAINTSSKKSRMKTQSHFTLHNYVSNSQNLSNKQNSLNKLPHDLKRRLLFQSTFAKKQQNLLHGNKNCKQIKQMHNFSKPKTKTQSDNYAHQTQDTLSLKKLRLDMQRIKNMQSYLSKKSHNTSIKKQQSKSHSKSKGKKGMTCTLYQKSLQKNSLNYSKDVIKNELKQSQPRQSQGEIDLNNRFLSFEEPSQFDSKIIKRIKLKKKQKQISQSKTSKLLKDSNKNCFESINILEVIGKGKQLKNNKQKQVSLIQKNQKQDIKNNQEKGRSLQKRNLFSATSKQRTISTIQKAKNQNNQTITIEGMSNINIKAQQKFSSAMQKIKSYKFISAYFSDLQLEGLLNQYQKAGEQQCKWPLLVIDEVYQKIKHVDQTKLKGMQHSREYYYE